jgi:hypothetical protein
MLTQERAQEICEQYLKDTTTTYTVVAADGEIEVVLTDTKDGKPAVKGLKLKQDQDHAEAFLDVLRATEGLASVEGHRLRNACRSIIS